MPSLNTGNAILSNPIKVDSSYNVGIGGAASGSFKLQVTGTTNLTGALTGTSGTFSSNVSTTAATIFAKASGTEPLNYQLSAITLGYDATNNIGWITAGGAAARTNLILQQGGGSVGIGTGTINGGSKLQVDSANGTAYSSNAQLRVSSGGVNNNRAQILFSDNALSDGKISYYPAAAEADRFFSISARTTESDFVIRGNGNVGIGDTSPTSNNNNTSNPVLSLKSTTAGAYPSYVTKYINGAEGGMTLAGSLYIDIGGNSTAANNAIVFRTTDTSSNYSTAERMKISSAGIITAPSQVSFKAYLSNNPELTKGVNNTVPYNAEEYDTQSNFSTSTYRFTAPIAGKYLFTVNLNVYGLDDTARFTIALLINSSSTRLLYGFANLPTGNTGDTNFSGSDILNLAAGNTVEVRIVTDGSGSFYMSQSTTYNSFSGHLLG